MNVELGKYNKAIVAVLAALGVLGAALSDGNISVEEAIAVGSAFVGAFGVYQIRNKK